MASSPTESAGREVAPTPVAFALQELIACWDQSYEALVRGDLDRVMLLLDVAHDHVAGAGDGSHDSPAEAKLRHEAASAHGRLQHGMKTGLTGLQEELGRVRQGGKVLRGYGNATLGVGGNVEKSI